MGSNNPENSNAIAGALTYPGRSDGNMQAVSEQPRQPRNLQGLLRFAMEATKSEDAPGNSSLGPMDEERRKFLEEALRSLTVDMAMVIQEAIEVLTDSDKMKSIQPGEMLTEDVYNAFGNILNCIDDIDFANDFAKMGGFAIFPICYSSENDTVRARASEVLAELCQNNPFCQERALDCGLLNILLNMVQSERGLALTKGIYAISCATREYPPACREFIAQGGCDIFVQLVATPDLTPRTKAIFLVNYFAYHYPDAREQFIQHNLVRIVAEQLKEGRDETSEHLLRLLLGLIQDSDSIALKQCRDPALGLRKIIENHLKHPELRDDRFSEEKAYAQQLLKEVFENCPPVEEFYEEVADR